MNRTKAFLSNSMSTALLQIVTMVIGFIQPRIMLSYYGSEINGLISSVSQFIGYFNLVETGLSSAAVFALYKPLAENNTHDINAVVSAAKKFYTQAGWIFTALTTGMAVIYPIFVKSEAASPLSITAIVFILGVNGCLEFFSLSKYRALLTADQKTYIISIASIVQNVIYFGLVVILTRIGMNIVLLRLIALISVFARSAILMIYCRRHYKYLDYSVEPNTKALDKRWDALYLQVLGTVQNNTPVLFLTVIMRNLKAVSLYSIFNMVASGIAKVLGIFTSGLSASFGNVIFKKETETLKSAYRQFEFSYYSLITIVYTIMLITIMPFVKIYTAGVTDMSYNEPLVGAFITINGFLYNIKTPQGMLVHSAGLYKETRVQTTIQVVLIIVFGLIFVPFMGVAGILLAEIVSNIYRDIDLIHFISKRVTHVPVRETYFRILRMVACIALSCAASMLVTYAPASLVQWFVYAIIISVIVVAVTIAINIIFDFKECKNLLIRVKGLVSK